MNIDQRRFNFLAIMTLLVVVLYVAASAVALYQGAIGFQQFKDDIGPSVTMLLGYWLRDATSARSGT